jgi:hypothetical protein
MSKYRCSRCGATHRNEERLCRLCGMDLTGEHIPLYTKQEKQDSGKRRGIGSLAAWGALGVLAVGALAIALGLTDQDEAVREAAQSAPVLDLSSPDGWQAVEDPEGGVVFDLPGTAIQSETPFSATTDGQATVWTADILDETRIQVLHGELPEPTEADTDRLRLEALADAWAAQTGTTVRDSTVGTFAGEPAIDVELNRWPTDDPRPGRAYIVIRDDTRVYVVQVHSVYPELSQFPRVVDSLEFT